MMTPDEKQARIQRAMGALAQPGHTYPGKLPEALADWYVYTLDGGHSILVVVTRVYEEDPATLDRDDAIVNCLAPVPVKAVLRVGYTVDPVGYVWWDGPYDHDLGVITQEDDDEF
jgi:hypothetical protein